MADNPELGDSGLMNYALRMVIPMRREFERSLNVQHFLHDLSYAKEVLDEALTSQNPKLRAYAGYLEAKLFGPRNSDQCVGSLDPNVGQPYGVKDTVVKEESTINNADEEARLLVFAKYKTGLR